MRKVCAWKIVGNLEAHCENRSQKKTLWRIQNRCAMNVGSRAKHVCGPAEQAESLFALHCKVH